MAEFLEWRFGVLDAAVDMDEDDFIRERLQRIKEIAKDADPFIKKRLADLANSYERRLNRPTRPPVNLTGLETKMPPER
jgi:hypothetical protein